MNVETMENFLNKIEQEAPSVIKTSIGNDNLTFNLIEDYIDEESLLEYEVNIRGVEKIFQIQTWEYSDGQIFRLEIRTPDVRSYQITCFHFNQLGFFENKQLIAIEQVVKVSGQSGSEENQRIKEIACKLLNQEGLLVERENKSPKWHVGTYNVNEIKWIHGQNTLGFIKNFLKVAVIMAHARGNRGFSLSEEKEKSTVNQEIQSHYPKKHNRHISPKYFRDLREKWEKIGLDGELFVLKTEKARLTKNGRRDLAEKVSHVSLENCAAGYDILLFELDERPRFIECKTTKGNNSEFELSINEWNTAIKYREQYYIYQIKHIYENPTVTIFQDPYSKMEDQTLMLNPSAFTVTY
jgi:hypothetical protein